jgi:hypothetical protein
MHSIIQNVDVKIYVVQIMFIIINYVSFKLLYDIDFNIYVLYNWVH